MDTPEPRESRGGRVAHPLSRQTATPRPPSPRRAEHAAVALRGEASACLPIRWVLTQWRRAAVQHIALAARLTRPAGSLHASRSSRAPASNSGPVKGCWIWTSSRRGRTGRRDDPWSDPTIQRSGSWRAPLPPLQERSDRASWTSAEGGCRYHHYETALTKGVKGGGAQKGALTT